MRSAASRCPREPVRDGSHRGGRTTAQRQSAPTPAAAPTSAAAPAGERGQSSVELLGLLPALIALALGILQLFAVGYAGILAGNAAEAGALALAAGADVEAGVREALPGWSRAGARVSVDDGLVTVRLRPPSAIEALAERLEVTAEAAVEAG